MGGRNPGQSTERVRREPSWGGGCLTFQVMPWYPPPGSTVGSSPAAKHYSYYMEEDFPRAHKPGGKSRFWFLGRDRRLKMGGRTLRPSSNFRLVTKCTVVMKPLVRPTSLYVRKPVKGAILCMIKDNPAVKRLYRRTSTY